MKRVKYDPMGLRKHGVVCLPAEGGVVKITFPGTETTKPYSVMAALEGDELVLFPERSSGHQRVVDLCSG